MHCRAAHDEAARVAPRGWRVVSGASSAARVRKPDTTRGGFYAHLGTKDPRARNDAPPPRITARSR